MDTILTMKLKKTKKQQLLEIKMMRWSLYFIGDSVKIVNWMTVNNRL